MYTVKIYESSREDPSMYKVGNKGEREREEDNITRKEERIRLYLVIF